MRMNNIEVYQIYTSKQNKRGTNPRGKDGRFIKMSHGRSVYLSSTLSGQRELLRNHENRIREIEKKLLNDQPKYINFGGAGGCNGTC